MMELIEEFIQSKTGQHEDCEDAYFVNENYAAVIDGATNVTGRLFNGLTPGQLAAKMIKETLAGTEGNETIQDILTKINKQYETMYQKLGIEQEVKETSYLRPSAVMTLYSKHHSKIWMIGDCQCYFNGVIHRNTKHIDDVFAEARSILMKSELIKGSTEEQLRGHDIGFDLIKPLIRQQYNFQNTTPECSLSYGVINGFDIPDRLIKTIDVPEGVEYISFASDGYPELYDSLEKTERHLSEMLAIDPLCINENMETKGIEAGNVSYDDRIFIKVKI